MIPTSLLTGHRGVFVFLIQSQTSPQLWSFCLLPSNSAMNVITKVRNVISFIFHFVWFEAITCVLQSPPPLTYFTNILTLLKCQFLHLIRQKWNNIWVGCVNLCFHLNCYDLNEVLKQVVLFAHADSNSFSIQNAFIGAKQWEINFWLCWEAS